MTSELDLSRTYLIGEPFWYLEGDLPANKKYTFVPYETGLFACEFYHSQYPEGDDPISRDQQQAIYETAMNMLADKMIKEMPSD